MTIPGRVIEILECSHGDDVNPSHNRSADETLPRRKPNLLLLVMGFLCLVITVGLTYRESVQPEQQHHLATVLLALAMSLMLYGMCPVDVHHIKSEIRTPYGQINVFGPIGVGLFVFFALNTTGAKPIESGPRIHILREKSQDPHSLLVDGKYRLTLVAIESFSDGTISKLVKNLKVDLSDLNGDQQRAALDAGFARLVSRYRILATRESDALTMIRAAVDGAPNDLEWANFIKSGLPTDKEKKNLLEKQLARMMFGVFRIDDRNSEFPKYVMATEGSPPLAVGKKKFDVLFIYALSSDITKSPRAAVLEEKQ